MLPISDGVPAKRFPLVNVLLIAANFVVWLFYELPHLDASVDHASFYPCSLSARCVPRAMREACRTCGHELVAVDRHVVLQCPDRDAAAFANTERGGVLVNGLETRKRQKP